MSTKKCGILISRIFTNRSVQHTAQSANPVVCRSEVQRTLSLCGSGFRHSLSLGNIDPFSSLYSISRSLYGNSFSQFQDRDLYHAIRSADIPRQLPHNTTIRSDGRSYQAIQYPCKSCEVRNRI